jgi:hypothetical protein
MNAFGAAEQNGKAADLQKELEALFERENTSQARDATSIPATFCASRSLFERAAARLVEESQKKQRPSRRYPRSPEPSDFCLLSGMSFHCSITMSLVARSFFCSSGCRL